MELLEIVTEFRAGLLDGRSSWGMCFVICAPLQGYLGICGHETKLVEADWGLANHVWLELPDGTIIDPTADQFSPPEGEEPLPAVYIGPLPAWYEEWKVGSILTAHIKANAA